MLCKRKPVVCVVIQEEFEDTKVVIRVRMSKKNRQHNGLKCSGGKTVPVPLLSTHPAHKPLPSCYSCYKPDHGGQSVLIIN